MHYRPDITPAFKLHVHHLARKPAPRQPTLLIDVIKPQPYSRPAQSRQQRSLVLHRRFVVVPR
jgi:hypothetical protein